MTSGPSMLGRFEGPEGRQRLLQALSLQKLIMGSTDLANSVANAIRLQSYRAGESLIRQDDSDNDLYLILSGATAVLVHGREMAKRLPGDHVGEMAILDPGSRRSATVLAIEHTVAAVISEPAFSAIANDVPIVWRRLAAVLGDRLRQRSSFIRPRNEQPIVFIGSSRESLAVAEGVRDGLPRRSTIVRLWSEGVFGASNFPIEDLEREVQSADYGILVLGPDDRVSSRGVAKDAPRDNVVFELGLVMGACGRRRAFLLVPNGMDVKIPSDVLGLTPIAYDPTTTPISAGVQNACEVLVQAIVVNGPR